MKLALLLILMHVAVMPAKAEELAVVGTGDSEKILAELAAKFEAANPGDKVSIPPSIGSGGGIKAVTDGSAKLARIARPLSDSEKQNGVKTLLFGRSPVVFVANGESVTNLKSDDVVKLFEGKIENWKDLGGKDQKLYLIVREKGDSSTTVISEQIPKVSELKSYAGKTAYSTPDTIALITAHKQTLGYVPLGIVPKSALRILKLDGVAPTKANVVSKKYKLAVPFMFAWKGELTGIASRFVKFVHESPQARALLEANGVFPGD